MDEVRDISSWFSAMTDEMSDRHPLPDHGSRWWLNWNANPPRNVQWRRRWGRYSTSFCLTACITLWTRHIIRVRDLDKSCVVEEECSRYIWTGKFYDRIHQASLRHSQTIFTFDGRVKSKSTFYLFCVGTRKRNILFLF